MGLNLINEARIVEEIGCKIVFSLRNKMEFIMLPQEQKYEFNVCDNIMYYFYASILYVGGKTNVYYIIYCTSCPKKI